MLENEMPHRRPTSDSLRPERLPQEPADRRARRLGVLGYVECRRSDFITMAPNDRGRVSSDGAPCLETKCPKQSVFAAVLQFPMIAA